MIKEGVKVVILVQSCCSRTARYKQGWALPIITPAGSQVVDLVVGVLLFLLPESQVLLEELNDALGVAEVILLELIDLVEGGLQSVISQLASNGVILKHFVVENREVEGETELDRVASGKVDVVGLFVSFFSLLLDVFEHLIFSVLSNIAIVVTDHLHEESLGLIAAFLSKHILLDHFDNLIAVSLELIFNFGLVIKESSIELRVLRVLLNG